MDTLRLQFGTFGESVKVREDVWDHGPAVGFDLPNDGRLIARAHIPALIEWLQGFLEETAPPLPTLPHATIKAKLLPDGTERVLTLIEPQNEPSWASHEEGLSADWFHSEAIAFFEVLFPGVEES